MPTFPGRATGVTIPFPEPEQDTLVSPGPGTIQTPDAVQHPGPGTIPPPS
jgi:hypothetical protein